MSEGLPILIAALGAITTVLGIILSTLALWRRIAEALRKLILGVLADAGLIKPMKQGETLQDVWPNGSANLPDFLNVIWRDVGKVKDEQDAVREALRRTR